MNQTKLEIARIFFSGLALLSLPACTTPSVPTEESSLKPPIIVTAGGDAETYDGDINKASIRRAIRGKLHYLKSCYEDMSSQMDDTDATKVVARIEKGFRSSSAVLLTTQKNHSKK
jgi:hypothetical protein